MKDYLSPAQASKETGFHVETIREWLRDGKLKGVKMGGSWRVKLEAFEQMGEQRDTQK